MGKWELVYYGKWRRVDWSILILRCCVDRLDKWYVELIKLTDKTMPGLIQFHTLKNAVNPPLLAVFLFLVLWQHRQNSGIARVIHLFQWYSVTIEKLSLKIRAIVKMYKNVQRGTKA